MKNNRKNRSRQNRGNQPHEQNRCQNRCQERCAQKPADVSEIFNSVKLLGTGISISEPSTVTLTREEYDGLMFCSALVDILQWLYSSAGKYAMCDLLENIFKDDDDDEEE